MFTPCLRATTILFTLVYIFLRLIFTFAYPKNKNMRRRLFILSFCLACIENLCAQPDTCKVGNTFQQVLTPLSWHLSSNVYIDGTIRHRSPLILPEIAYDGSTLILYSNRSVAYTYNIYKEDDIKDEGTIVLNPGVETTIDVADLTYGLYRIELYIGGMAFYAEFSR